MKTNEPLISSLQLFEETIPEVDDSILRNLLIEKIRYLLDEDFEKLLNALYRIDVNEEKLKKLLDDFSQTDPAIVIADTIIARQAQKIESRKKYSSDPNSENEWK